MKSITRIGLGLGAAAVVASGGSAFTGSNTLPASDIAGHGEASVTGVVVTNIEYDPLTTDSNKLLKVVFRTSTAGLTDATQKMIMTTSTTTAASAGDQIACSVGIYTTQQMPNTADITCDLSAGSYTPVALDTLKSVGLTVTAR